jgi:hypothetical protein
MLLLDEFPRNIVARSIVEQNTKHKFYSRDVHPVARVIKSQDTNPRSQQSVNMLYFVVSMITTCFGLRKRPSSGDYHVIQNIKKKVTIRCNGAVESNSSNFLLDILHYMIIT